MSAEPAPLRRLAPVDLDTGEVVHPEIARLQEEIHNLKQAIKGEKKRDDERREFHPPLLSAARHGGSYVHTWPGPGHAQLPQAVGAAHGVSPRRLESGGLLVWSRVAGCDEVAPAVWA
jgi:hypothetical protein